MTRSGLGRLGDKSGCDNEIIRPLVRNRPIQSCLVYNNACEGVDDLESEMTQPAKVQEPSMEEILASIRRIIADDEAKPPVADTKPAAVERPAAPPPARAEKPPAPAPAPKPVMNDIPPSKIAPPSKAAAPAPPPAPAPAPPPPAP